jgi:hypothetical protein
MAGGCAKSKQISGSHGWHPGMWHQVTSPNDVPNDRDVRLAVIDARGKVHTLVFPCRRVGDSWIDTKLQRKVEVHPTHWQVWTD